MSPDMEAAKPDSCEVTKVDVARALRQLGILLQGRVSLLRAMSVVERATSNPRLASALAFVRQELENGARLASAFSECPFMSAVALELLSTAEEHGALDTQLPLIADYLLQDAALDEQAGLVASMQGRFVLRGTEVGLAPWSQDLLPVCRRWFADSQTLLFCGANCAKLLDSLLTAADTLPRTSPVSAFAVRRLPSERLIGLSWLLDIDYRNRTAELGVLIGEAGERGRGCGTEAVRLTLDTAFNLLGLNNVIAVVPEFNTAGIQTAHKAGFREFGRRRRSFHAFGRLWDLVCLECLADEFDSPVLRRASPANPT